MDKNIKRVLKVFVVMLLMLTLAACKKKPEPTPTPTPIPTVSVTPSKTDAKPEPSESKLEVFTITYKLENGEADIVIEAEEGSKLSVPATPNKEGYLFVYWYLDDLEVAVDFETLVVSKDLVITALFGKLPPSTLELMEEDILEVEGILAGMELGAIEVELPKNAENGSRITWKTSSPYISTSTGLMIPPRYGDNSTEAVVTGTFRLDGEKIDHEFTIALPVREVFELSRTEVVPFTNLTTEYDVADRSVDLYFSENGSVPYIKVVEFFELLHGFIDPELELSYETTEDGVLTVAYDYYSKSQDHLFHLTAIIDTNNQTITTEDPGFYSAYVQSTETNYGRHIKYDNDNENGSYKEGTDLVLYLAEYNLSALFYDGDVVLPYALANQIFAGASYYNVYYNGDGLFGVYSLPGPDDIEFKTMKTSSKNGTNMEYDMFLVTYDMIAFNFDHFYGLKGIMNVDSYYSVLDKNSNSLLTLEPRKFDDALFTMINKDIDELHTSFDAPSHYNRTPMPEFTVTNVSEFGSRVANWYNSGIFDIQRALGNAFPDGKQPNYWTLDDKTAVVTLESFRTLDIEESSLFDESLVSKILKADNILPEITSGDKFFFINSSTTSRRILNILIKNTSEGFALEYGLVLESAGLDRVEDTNYYKLKEGGVDYTVHVNYSEETKLLTVSVVDVEYDANRIRSHIKTGAYDYVKGDSAVYLEIILEQLFEENPEVENILLDISYNTGGNVGALYRVVGFITGEPFRVTSISPDTNSASTSFVYIDGVPVYDHINWGLLVSTVSFSAANSLTTIFKENNLGPVIGTKTGGGAASITPILLPNGTSFIMSSNNVGGYRTGSGTEEDPYVYHDNELGITPDIILKNNRTLYNKTNLLNAVDEAFKEE